MNPANIKEEIKRLTQRRYTALPCSVILSPEGKKVPFFGYGFGWSNRTGAEYLSNRFQVLGNNTNGLIILTGGTLLVVDLDRKPGKDPDGALNRAGISFPARTPRARTPFGEHYYLKYPAGLRSGTHAGLFEKFSGIDSRGIGGFVYAPPTEVKNYGSYRWIVDPFEHPLAVAPRKLVDYLTQLEAPRVQTDNMGCKTLNQLTPKQKAILNERYEQARREADKEPRNRDRSHYDFRLICWAVDIRLEKETLWRIVHDFGKFAENGQGYFERTYQAALCRGTR